jgi:hypothetical protein
LTCLDRWVGIQKDSTALAPALREAHICCPRLPAPEVAGPDHHQHPSPNTAGCKNGYGGAAGTTTGCAQCAAGTFAKKAPFTQGCAACATVGANVYAPADGAAACSLCPVPKAATASGKACGEAPSNQERTGIGLLQRCSAPCRVPPPCLSPRPFVSTLASRPSRSPGTNPTPLRPFRPCPFSHFNTPPPPPPTLWPPTGSAVSTTLTLVLSTADGCTDALKAATRQAYYDFLSNQKGVVAASIDITVTCTELVGWRVGGGQGGFQGQCVARRLVIPPTAPCHRPPFRPRLPQTRRRRSLLDGGSKDVAIGLAISFEGSEPGTCGTLSDLAKEGGAVFAAGGAALAVQGATQGGCQLVTAEGTTTNTGAGGGGPAGRGVVVGFAASGPFVNGPLWRCCNRSQEPCGGGQP